MNHHDPGKSNWFALSLLILLTLSGCRLVSLIKTPSVEPTPTQTQTPTLTPEFCAWTWAYGEGSTDFDNTVTQKLTVEGIAATIISSSYGEIYSCDHSFHPMALDIKVEIKVENLADQDLLTKTTEVIFSLLRNNLSISNVNNLGNVSLAFITPEGNNCFWNIAQQQCAE